MRCFNILFYLALILYDYFITLTLEVELFWKGKCRSATMLFYFNRYLSIIYSIYGLASNAHISTQVCET